MIAFTLPFEDKIFILSYQGLHTIYLSPEIKVTTDKKYAEHYDIYDEKENKITCNNQAYAALGFYGGDPILQDFQQYTLNFDKKRQQLNIIALDKHIIQSIPYSDLSGDWAFATFSPDSNYLVIGVPDDLYLFKRDRLGE